MFFPQLLMVRPDLFWNGGFRDIFIHSFMKEAFGPMRLLSGQGHSAQSCRNRNRAVDKLSSRLSLFL